MCRPCGVLGSLEDKLTIAAAKEMSRFSRSFALEALAFMPTQEHKRFRKFLEIGSEAHLNKSRCRTQGQSNVSCQMACCAMCNVLGAITKPPNGNLVKWVI